MGEFRVCFWENDFTGWKEVNLFTAIGVAKAVKREGRKTYSVMYRVSKNVPYNKLVEVIDGNQVYISKSLIVPNEIAALGSLGIKFIMLK